MRKRGISIRREHIIDAIKTGLSSLEAGVEVHLYGSEARGEAHDKSDIDLLVLVPKDKVTLQDELEITAPLYDIELKTGVLINALILPKREWGKIQRGQEPGSGHTLLNTTNH